MCVYGSHSISCNCDARAVEAELFICTRACVPFNSLDVVSIVSIMAYNASRKHGDNTEMSAHKQGWIMCI